MAIPFLVPTAIAIVTEFFPLLATKLAGPRGAEVATKVMSAAATAAKLPQTSDPREILAAIKKNPDAVEELRFRFEQMNAEEHEHILEDRKNARSYQLNAGTSGRKRGDVMLVVVGVALIICIFAAWTGKVENSAALALVTTIAGAMLKMFSDAFAFEFGSSRGSKEKDDQLANFREAMLSVGKENRTAALDIIREQNQTIPDMAQKVMRSADKAVAATAGAAEAAMETVKRDFVGQLVRGEI